jgi:hypothetical protein
VPATKTLCDHELWLESAIWPLAALSAQRHWLLMRSGVFTISSIRDGEIPLEMVAAIAGIVVFMGFVQLVIAFILKMRGRQ